MAIIDLKHISKEYRSDTIVTPALTDIDLRIDKGEFIAIMGTSGSGKTTLLNIIGCMDMPTTGTYLFDGTELSLSREKQLSSIRGKRIAFVFQHFALIDDYTVFENVEVPLMKQNYTKTERKKKVSAALKTVGIFELARKRPVHISGGQKQRVAIARAMACGADIILADEPTGSVTLVQHYPKEIPVILFSLSTLISLITDRHSVRFSSRVSVS